MNDFGPMMFEANSWVRIGCNDHMVEICWNCSLRPGHRFWNLRAVDGLWPSGCWFGLGSQRPEGGLATFSWFSLFKNQLFTTKKTACFGYWCRWSWRLRCELNRHQISRRASGLAFQASLGHAKSSLVWDLWLSCGLQIWLDTCTNTLTNAWAVMKTLVSWLWHK